MPLSHLLLALLVALVWGANFAVIKIGVLEMPPLLLCALRFALAAFPALLFVPRPPVSWGLLAAFGITIGVVKFGLLFEGMALGMPAGLSSVVLQAQAFFTIVFAAALLRERPKAVQLAALAVALAGLAVIAGARGEPGAIGPLLLVILAAVAWGVANIIAKRAGKVDMLGFIVWASLFAPLPLLALSYLLEGPEAMLQALVGITWTGLGSLLYLAFLATLLAYWIWNGLLSSHPASLVAPFSLLVPVFGIAAGSLLLGERVSPAEAAGSLLILLALAVNTLGPRLARWRAAPRRDPAGE